MLPGNVKHVGIAKGGTTALVEFVEISGKKYVLKTDKAFNVSGEEKFQQELKNIGLPHIEMYGHAGLKSNQLLMEFIDGQTLNGKNFTNNNLALLGRVVSSLHSRKYDLFQRLDGRGSLRTAHWKVFVKNLANTAKSSSYAKTRLGVIPAIDIASTRLIEQTDLTYVLCHGDIHGNNVLLRGKELILFDNNADAYVATAHYDLAVLFGEVFSGYRYGSKNSQGPNDNERMEAFLSGYGMLPNNFNEYIDDYVFLRLLSRYPNRFIRYQDDIIARLQDVY